MSTLETAERSVKSALGRVAIHSRRDEYNDPDKVAVARTDVLVARAEVAIHRALAAAPPLTTAQRERLAALLTGGAK